MALVKTRNDESDTEHGHCCSPVITALLSILFDSSGSSPRLCIWWCRSRSHAAPTCCWTGWGAGGTALLGRHSCPDRWWPAYGRYRSNTWRRGRTGIITIQNLTAWLDLLVKYSECKQQQLVNGLLTEGMIHFHFQYLADVSASCIKTLWQDK